MHSLLQKNHRIVFLMYFHKNILICIYIWLYNERQFCVMYTKNCFLCNSYIKKTAQGWRYIMKYLKQFLIILVISLIGEILNKLLPLPVPASIYGMVILFAGLLSGIIKLESVKRGRKFSYRNNACDVYSSRCRTYVIMA